MVVNRASLKTFHPTLAIDLRQHPSLEGTRGCNEITFSHARKRLAVSASTNPYLSTFTVVVDRLRTYLRTFSAFYLDPTRVATGKYSIVKEPQLLPCPVGPAFPSRFRSL